MLEQLQVKGDAESIVSYSFIDTDPLPGMNYYRLKQVDVSGQDSYSNIISADMYSMPHSYVYPNPATYVIHLPALPIHSTVTVVNMLGEIQYTSLAKEEIDISFLKSGFYQIHINSPSVSMTFPFLKE
jgi:hypothetical protein